MAEESVREATGEVEIDRRSFDDRQREALLKNPQVEAAVEALQHPTLVPAANPSSTHAVSSSTAEM